jgi:FkbM family methyltransferase
MSYLKRLALKLPPIRRLWLRNGALLAENAELRSTSRSSPFDHYHAVFDPIEVIRRHEVAGVEANPAYFTNFLGVKIDPKFVPSILANRAGEVEGVPIPGNWHADIAEFGAALRAVDLSENHFSIVELGCGWGCWLNIAGTAARNAGREVHLIGVEGDEGHIAFAREACSANGFTPEQVTLHHGIAAATNGTALFPTQAHSGGNWGLAPIFGATEAERDAAIAAGSHDALPMIALADLVGAKTRIDLLHIDIQGGEADFVAGCLGQLSERVAYIVVGTHSRSIEGKLFELMLGAGWVLEIERPAILALTPKPEVIVDGVQGWRNPTLFR